MIESLIDNPSTLDPALLKKELHSGKRITIQFSYKKYTDKMLADIDQLCSEHDEKLCIRFYSHDSVPFNCNTVLKIPHVKNLYADCLDKANNCTALTQLEHLSHLSLGIGNLTEIEILQSANFKKLTALSLTSPNGKGLNLAYLKDYDRLEDLYIDGHCKDIEALGKLKNLNRLYLRAIKNCTLGFINSITTLKSLSLLLGGRTNINEIGPNAIEQLEIDWVRGFTDLSNIGNFTALKTLRIADQKQLKELHFTSVLSLLHTISIANCKSLDTINGLHLLPQLNKLHVYKTAVSFDDFIQQPIPNSLKYFTFYSSSSKLDKGIEAKLKSRGYSDW